MKVKIDNDVFDIAKRIKEIDEGYFILFDLDKNVYELHNKYQSTSFCLTIPYANLDNRVIDLILYSDISNIDNIIIDIDTNNEDIERNNKNTIKNQTDFMLREIYDFSSNSSKKMCNNSFATIWR